MMADVIRAGGCAVAASEPGDDRLRSGGQVDERSASRCDGAGQGGGVRWGEARAPVEERPVDEFADEAAVEDSGGATAGTQ
jgi:hypothetical protein